MMDNTTTGGKRLLLVLSLVAAAVVAATLLALAAADPAEAKKKKKPKPPTTSEKIVFSSDRDGDLEIFSINPDGTGLKQLTFNAALDDSPVISPDGTKIAYSSDATGNREIFTINTDGTGIPTQITNDPGKADNTPDYSPDGLKIAFSKGVSFDAEVYVMNADGTGPQNFTSSNPAIPDFRPNYSPDGTKIAYTSIGDTGTNAQGAGGLVDGRDFEVYTMNAADGSTKTNLSDTDPDINEFRPDYSPDGTKIVHDSAGAFALNPEGDFEVFVIDSSNGLILKNLTNNNTDDLRPNYSPDGTKIVYDRLPTASGTPSQSPTVDGDLFTINADGSTPLTLTNTGNASINTLADWDTVVLPPACSDGLDNDGDTKIDFPADKGCKSDADRKEKKKKKRR